MLRCKWGVRAISWKTTQHGKEVDHQGTCSTGGPWACCMERFVLGLTCAVYLRSQSSDSRLAAACHRSQMEVDCQRARELWGLLGTFLVTATVSVETSQYAFKMSYLWDRNCLQVSFLKSDNIILEFGVQTAMADLEWVLTVTYTGRQWGNRPRIHSSLSSPVSCVTVGQPGTPGGALWLTSCSVFALVVDLWL